MISASAPGPLRRRPARRRASGTSPSTNATRAMAPRRDAKTLLVELVRLFRRLAARHRPHPQPQAGLVRTGRRAAPRGVPVVVNTVHGLYALPDDPPGQARRRLRARARSRRPAPTPSSSRTPRTSTSCAGSRVPAHKLHLLGNGDRPRALRPDRAAPRRAECPSGASASPRTTIVFGAVGRLVWEKGLPRDVRRRRPAPVAARPDARVVVVGPVDPDKPDGSGPRRPRPHRR